MPFTGGGMENYFEEIIKVPFGIQKGKRFRTAF
jgi:hypothetical protein